MTKKQNWTKRWRYSIRSKFKMAASQLLSGMANCGNKAQNEGNGKGQYKSWSEYCEALNKWNMECHRWYAYHALFPYYVAQQLNTSVGPHLSASNVSRPDPNVQGNAAQAERQGNWTSYKVATLWKRVLAEIIDFMLLFTVKLLITFFVIDYFQILDLDRYSEALKIDQLHKVSYDMLLELTSELMILELVTRLVVCTFESICLQGGNNIIAGIGGATPGKRAMGLRIVSCKFVVWQSDPEIGRISILEASNLGFWRAFGRSTVKNFSIAFCLPASFTVHMFQHNRAVYDILFNCIVVEDDPS